MSDRRRFLDLLSRHLDGVPDPAAIAELTALLDADPAGLDELVELERLDRRLRGLIGPAAPAELMVERVLAGVRGEASGRSAAIVERIRAERPPWRRRRAFARGRWGALAAMVIAAIAVWATWAAQRSAPMGNVLAVVGDARCRAPQGAAVVATPGLRLPAGTSIELGSGASLSFSLDVGARVALDDGARLSLARSGPAIRLDAGRLAVEVQHQPAGRPFRIATPQGEAEAVGTGFTLTVGTRTDLAVSAGTVRLRSSTDAAGILVPAGATAEAGPAGVFRSLSFGDARAVTMVGINDQSAEFTGGNGRLWRPTADAPQLLAITLPGEYRSRILLRFDDLRLPPGTRIAQARLRLRCDCWATPARIDGAYLAAAWNAAGDAPDGLGWLNRDRGAPWTRPGGDADVLAVSGFGVELGDHPSDETVLLDPAVVQDWIDHPERNHGVILRNPTSSPVRIAAPASPSVDERPRLILAYRP